MSRSKAPRLAQWVLPVSFLAASGCASVPQAPEMPKDALAESLYVTQPWAERPPVDIYQHLSAMQAAGASAQQSLNAYTAALRAQAAQETHRMRLQAQLRNYELAQRDERARQLAEARRQAEAEAASRNIGKPVRLGPMDFRPEWAKDTGWQLGVVTWKYMCGWNQRFRKDFKESMEKYDRGGESPKQEAARIQAEAMERARNPCEPIGY